MITGSHRKTNVFVDLQAIDANLKQELARLKPGQSLFAVVKADAYGHGLLPVAQQAKKSGATGFCVAVIDEGLALRQAGFHEDILILGVNPASEALCLAQNDLAVAVGSMDFLKEAVVLLKEAALRLKVHLALDTGMGRIGFCEKDQLKEAVTFLAENQKQFEFEGIFTHFASADSPDERYYQQQVAKFKDLMQVVPEKPRYVHTANSAAALWHDAKLGNMVRFGIAMYGLNPDANAQVPPFELKPALSLESELVFVKKVKAQSAIGYGSTYVAKEDEWIGTVPVGYADGWLRRMQGFKLLVEGEWCEIVGRVCMDQIMIRLPQKYPVGTKVTLIGQNHGKQITAQDVAAYAKTIHYEIVCDLGVRIPRIYK